MSKTKMTAESAFSDYAKLISKASTELSEGDYEDLLKRINIHAESKLDEIINAPTLDDDDDDWDDDDDSYDWDEDDEITIDE